MARHIGTTTVLVFLCVSYSYGFFFKKTSLECPPSYNILPCTCTKENSTLPVIHCESVTSAEDLMSVMTAAKRQQGIIGVRLHSVALRYIPELTFNGTNIQFLEIANSSILSLGESDQAFLGLEDSLKSLSVINCTYVNNWEWSHLQKLVKLHHLSVTNSGLMELTEKFVSIAHLPLAHLSFKNNFINYLPYRAFANFTDLTRLSLDVNEIKELMRSMLPVPAKKLESLGLSYNKIPALPVNAFTGMPALKYVFLGGNPILSLNSEIFLPVWKQLQLFLVQDSPIICDCRLDWLPKQRRSKLMLIGGKCNNPPSMKGKRIATLQEDELSCEDL